MFYLKENKRTLFCIIVFFVLHLNSHSVTAFDISDLGSSFRTLCRGFYSKKLDRKLPVSEVETLRPVECPLIHHYKTSSFFNLHISIGECFKSRTPNSCLNDSLKRLGVPLNAKRIKHRVKEYHFTALSKSMEKAQSFKAKYCTDRNLVSDGMCQKIDEIITTADKDYLKVSRKSGHFRGQATFVELALVYPLTLKIAQLKPAYWFVIFASSFSLFGFFVLMILDRLQWLKPVFLVLAFSLGFFFFKYLGWFCLLTPFTFYSFLIPFVIWARLSFGRSWYLVLLGCSGASSNRRKPVRPEKE